jgi:hypothetical protein
VFDLMGVGGASAASSAPWLRKLQRKVPRRMEMRTGSILSGRWRTEALACCMRTIRRTWLTSTTTAPRAPNGLPDRVKLRSCERPEARRGRILDVFDRGATKGRDANPRFHDGRQTVRCSRQQRHRREDPRGVECFTLVISVRKSCECAVASGSRARRCRLRPAHSSRRLSFRCGTAAWRTEKTFDQPPRVAW